MNDKNLVPNSERTPDELREMGRKGGIASGEARRKKRDMQKNVKMWQQAFDALEGTEPEKLEKLTDKLMKHLQ